MIFGEAMPDANDPKYKERAERDRAAGRKFAEKSGLTNLVIRIQKWANKHPAAFLLIVFAFVVGCFGFNIGNMIHHYRMDSKAVHRGTAVEQVDSALSHQENMDSKTINLNH